MASIRGRSSFARFRNLAFHFRHQRIADIGIERRRIGMARRRARHRDTAAGAFMQAECVGRAGKFEIDQMKTVRDDEADGARQLLGDILQTQPDQIAKLQAPHHRGLIATALGPMRYFWSRGR